MWCYCWYHWCIYVASGAGCDVSTVILNGTLHLIHHDVCFIRHDVCEHTKSRVRCFFPSLVCVAIVLQNSFRFFFHVALVFWHALSFGRKFAWLFCAVFCLDMEYHKCRICTNHTYLNKMDNSFNYYLNYIPLLSKWFENIFWLLSNALVSVIWLLSNALVSVIWLLSNCSMLVVWLLSNVLCSLRGCYPTGIIGYYLKKLADTKFR